MCVTAVIAGASLLMSAVGTYSSIQSANAQADQIAAQEQFRRKQLSEQSAMEKIAAGAREVERLDDFAMRRSASMAAIGASGLGDHISFFQGVEPSSMDRLRDDVRAIRLNLTARESQIEDSITISEYEQALGRYNATQSKVGAMAGFAQDVMGAYSFYSSYNTGGGKK